jgi:CheY-like chemotaxis protein
MRRILIIDDEDDIREVAKLSLASLTEWDVLTAPSAKEGITRARDAHPDAILLDVMMPDMDGPAVLERLRHDPATQHIPVIFLTAKVQASDRRRFASLGVAAVISKPFDPLKLPGQIAEALGWTAGGEG